MAKINLEGLDAVAARLRELQARAPELFDAAVKAECDRVQAEMAPAFERASFWYHLTDPHGLETPDDD